MQQKNNQCTTIEEINDVTHPTCIEEVEDDDDDTNTEIENVSVDKKMQNLKYSQFDTADLISNSNKGNTTSKLRDNFNTRQKPDFNLTTKNNLHGTNIELNVYQSVLKLFAHPNSLEGTQKFLQTKPDNRQSSLEHELRVYQEFCAKNLTESQKKHLNFLLKENNISTIIEQKKAVKEINPY